MTKLLILVFSFDLNKLNDPIVGVKSYMEVSSPYMYNHDMTKWGYNSYFSILKLVIAMIFIVRISATYLIILGYTTHYNILEKIKKVKSKENPGMFLNIYIM